MNYLAIDTSGKNLTVIIKNGDNIYSYYDLECGVNHSVNLMPEIEKLIKKADFSLENADFFACVVGAGSFTGIRIGVSTVKALCFAFNKPCLSITSFDTLAYNENNGKVLALIDAKHNGFYACGYNDKKIDFEPKYILREEAEILSKNYDIIVSNQEILGFNIKIVSLLDGLKNAIREKQEEISYDIDALSPLYCRKSQAEEGR